MDWLKLYPRVTVIIRIGPNSFTFRYAELNPIITAAIVRTGPAKYAVNVSHFMKAPGQPLPVYRPAFRCCSSPLDAFQEFLSSYSQPYDAAVREGHRPSDSWLMRQDLQHFKRFTQWTPPIKYPAILR